MSEENGPTTENNLGQLIPIEIIEEMQRSYLNYAMSVIVSRALPDVKDGLKPVHRRILYAMYELGLSYEAKYRKSATVVGEVLGKYHPHGDSPVYDALVRLAQNFAMRYPLIDGQGNFGSVDGDPPAAMRYTEARMAKIASEMLSDIEKNTILFADNFDGTRKEPIVLPAKLPQLLLNGSSGIAVGMATNIPPHNLNEVCDAIIHLIENPEDAVEDLMKFIKGPDFPTGGSIFDINEIRQAYATGRGRIVMRAKAEIEEASSGKFAVVISELPYQVNKSQLVARIAQLVKEKKVEGISDLRDESDRKGMRVFIELKRDSRPKSILNNLYKHTAMQLAFNVNMVALVNGVPGTLTLKQALTEFIRHRQQVVTKRAEFDLNAAKNRAHILEGLKIALDHLDAVIETIRRSKDADIAKVNLMNKFKLTDIQAIAILDMQLRRLAALERQKVEDEYKAVLKTISYLEDLLSSPKKILAVIIKELTELKDKFGDERRTRVYANPIGEFSEEDLVAKSDTLITVTKTGYIKRLAPITYKSQRRGGKGVVGMTTKEEDQIDHLISATTHDTLLFFTDKGKVYGTKAWEIPETSRQAKGQALVNILDLEQGEMVLSILPISQDENAKNLVMATRLGMVKKTKLSEFKNMRTTGLIAIRLKAKDSLVSVHETKGKDHVLIVSKNGKAIRFPEANVRTMGRATSGVRGIKLNAGDSVIGMNVFPEKLVKPTDKRMKVFRDLLTISERGLGKRTATHLFPIQRRAGKGVKGAQTNEKTGALACATMVDEKVELIVLTSKSGQVIKLPLKNVPQMGRATQGVILMRFAKKADRVAAITTLSKKPE